MHMNEEFKMEYMYDNLFMYSKKIMHVNMITNHFFSSEVLKKLGRSFLKIKHRK